MYKLKNSSCHVSIVHVSVIAAISDLGTILFHRTPWLRKGDNELRRANVVRLVFLALVA